MSTQEKINDDLIEATKGREEQRISTLRLLVAAIKNKIIEMGKPKDEPLEDAEVVKIIKTQVKQLKDSIEDFKKGERPELVEKSEQEIKLLEQYLPEQMTDEEIKAVVNKTIEELGEGDLRDFGRLMGMVMKEVGDRADGSKVKQFLQESLSAE